MIDNNNERWRCHGEAEEAFTSPTEERLVFAMHCIDVVAEQMRTWDSLEDQKQMCSRILDIADAVLRGDDVPTAMPWVDIAGGGR